MPKITIHRTRDWTLKIGYSSISEVLLDGQRVGYESGGETSEFDVAQGQHKLKIKMGWYGSRDYNFNLFDKETKSFTVTSMRRYITVAAILFIIVVEYLHLILKIQMKQNIIHIIIASIILIFICFLIFGRNAFLFIKENKEKKATNQ